MPSLPRSAWTASSSPSTKPVTSCACQPSADNRFDICRGNRADGSCPQSRFRRIDPRHNMTFRAAHSTDPVFFLQQRHALDAQRSCRIAVRRRDALRPLNRCLRVISKLDTPSFRRTRHSAPAHRAHRAIPSIYACPSAFLLFPCAHAAPPFLFHMLYLTTGLPVCQIPSSKFTEVPLTQAVLRIFP